MSYIHEYTKLTPQETRQLSYKRRYKAEVPEWDDSMVLLRDLVAERLPAGATVLDIGCGRGNFVLDEIGDKVGKKTGFDLDQEATAGNVSMDEVVIGTSTRELPFAAESFDATVSLWVLEHVEDPDALFQEIARVLRPDGFFAFVTPNRRSLLIRLRRMMSKAVANKLLKRFYGRDDDDVFDVFYRANTIEDIVRAAASAGLKVDFLAENADPSYTSFHGFTYKLSVWFTACMPRLAKPHLIGVLRKRP